MSETFVSFLSSTLGQIIILAIILICVLIIAGIFYRRSFSVKHMTYAAIAMALSTALSFIKIGLPYGGSITLCSMFFICLISFWFGPNVGLLSAITYGLLQLVIEPQVYHPVQVLLDYPIAFGMLGISGFFSMKKFGIYTGFIISALARGICSIISGVVFFSEYAGEQNVWLYSIQYNMSYILPEIIITCVLISIPAFYKAILHVKATARA